MWSEADRAKYDRRHLRYPSDLTDAEWALIEALVVEMEGEEPEEEAPVPAAAE
jgi:hypothetical protein